MKIDPRPQLRKVSTEESKKTVEAISKLWYGEELDSDELAHLSGGTLTLRSVNKAKVREHPKTPDTWKLAMLGPFDAGTNLLSHTLRVNYPDLVEKACGSTVLCRVWKHGLNISEQFFVEGEQPLVTAFSNQKVRANETVLAVIVRSPLAQIAAWQLAPYNLGPCINRSVATYDQPCSTKGMTWDESGMEDSDSPLMTTFESTMNIYNRYLRMYKELKEGGQFHDVVIITYEDLVLAPEEVVADVASVMGWPALEKVKTIEKPAKKHGHFAGRDTAIKRLADRWWLPYFSSTARTLVCNGLDSEAYRGLQENAAGVPGFPVMPYGADCVGHEVS